jgi:hypothetical protein
MFLPVERRTIARILLIYFDGVVWTAAIRCHIRDRAPRLDLHLCPPQLDVRVWHRRCDRHVCVGILLTAHGGRISLERDIHFTVRSLLQSVQV